MVDKCQLQVPKFAKADLIGFTFSMLDDCGNGFVICM